jgi:hypothetical protein
LLRRLRAGDGKDEERNYRKETWESGDSKHIALLEGCRVAGADRPLKLLNCVISEQAAH